MVAKSGIAEMQSLSKLKKNDVKRNFNNSLGATNFKVAPVIANRMDRMMKSDNLRFVRLMTMIITLPHCQK